MQNIFKPWIMFLPTDDVSSSNDCYVCCHDIAQQQHEHVYLLWCDKYISVNNQEFQGVSADPLLQFPPQRTLLCSPPNTARFLGIVSDCTWVAGVLTAASNCSVIVIISRCSLIVLLNLLFNVGELVLQVLTPLPFFQICGILDTKGKKTNKFHILASFIQIKSLSHLPWKFCMGANAWVNMMYE